MGPNRTVATSNAPVNRLKTNEPVAVSVPASDSSDRRKGQKLSATVSTSTTSSNSNKTKTKPFNTNTNNNNNSNKVENEENFSSSNDLRYNETLNNSDAAQLQPEGQANFDEPDGRELASKCLLLQQKRFYLDVKQNKRGRFIKVAEVNLKRKSRILFSMSTAAEFCDLLLLFSNYDESQDDFPSQDERIKSERLQRDSRLYYFDLKENNRGRYLRCTQLSSHGPGPRSQITIPEPNILEFRTTMLELLNEFGQDDLDLGSSNQNADQRDTQQNSSSKSPPISNSISNGNVQLPEGLTLKTDNKRYYFDINQNQSGVHMKISEVKPTLRNTVTIPEKHWIEFRDMFNECMKKMNELRTPEL